MIKVYIFNKSNNILRVHDFKKFFQHIDSEISLMHCTRGRVHAGPSLQLGTLSTRIALYV